MECWVVDVALPALHARLGCHGNDGRANPFRSLLSLPVLVAAATVVGECFRSWAFASRLPISDRSPLRRMSLLANAGCWIHSITPSLHYFLRSPRSWLPTLACVLRSVLQMLGFLYG